LLRGPEQSGELIRVDFPQHAAPFPHEWLLVLLLPAAWWALTSYEINRLFARGTGWQWLWNMCELVFSDVDSLLALAYVFACLHFAWLLWKGYDFSCLLMPRVSPGRLAATWFGSLALAVTAGPAMAWLGFVFWTWPA
jgi:hypothetical protein